MKKNLSKRELSNLKTKFTKSVLTGNYREFQTICKILVTCDYDLFDFIKTTKIKTIKNKFNKIHSDNLLPSSTVSITKRQDTATSKKEKINSVDSVTNKGNSEYYSETFEKIEMKKHNEHKLKSELMKRIYISTNTLYLYRNEIKKFIEFEKELYMNLFNNDFDKCIELLDKINEEICYSSWAQLLKLSIQYLKVIYNSDNQELKKEFYDIFDEMFENSRQAFNSLVIHLHYHKLNDMLESNTDNTIRTFMTRLRQWKEEFSKSDEVYVKIFLEEFENSYFEKMALSPLNEQAKLYTLNKMLLESMDLSMIDLYKTFSSILIELQINEDDYFERFIGNKDSIINRVLKILPNANIIKLENIKNEEYALQSYIKKIDEVDLFVIFDKFLKGEFFQVIDDSLLLLNKKPYTMDVIYFIVHSLLYIKEPPEYLIKIKKIKEKSLMFDIIECLYYILGTNEKKEYIEKMKKILLCFGFYFQWNMYLYHLISNYLCKNDDKRSKKFSNAIKYSYFSHPRAYFSMSKNQQQIFLNEIENKYPTTYQIFKSCTIDKKFITGTVYPQYREQYIQFRSNKTKIDIIHELYEKRNEMPYFYQCKVITSYIESLITEYRDAEALKIIVDNHISEFMPLCMFNYKINGEYLFKNVKDSPYYPLLCIYDNPDDIILIHYAMKNYLSSISTTCKKPSHLKSFLEKVDNLEINLELLKKMLNHDYLAEFLISLKSRKEIIEEQLAIIEIIKIYDKSFDINNTLRKELNDKLKIIENRNFINDHKISINKEKIKKNLIDEVKLILENYSTSEYGEEKYRYYDYAEDKSLTYQSSNILREEKIENMFRITLKEILFSNIGILNSINENIIHNHLNDTLRQPLMDEKLFAQISNKKYEVSYWESNEYIQEKVIEFSKKLNEFLDTLKINIRDYSEKGFFNFDYDNLFNKKVFYKFIDIEKKLVFENLELEVYLEQIIQYVIEQLRKEIALGRERLKENLEGTMKKMFLIFKEVSNVKFLEHLNHAKENIENNSIKNIVSWFKLNETLINNDFQIIEVVDTLKKEYPELKNIEITYENFKVIKGQYFINFHRIYYIILHNIIRHSNLKNNTLFVSFKTLDNKVLIINKSKYKESKTDTRQNGTGLDFLNNNLKTINESNQYNKESTSSDFIITLELILEDIIND